MSTVGDEVRFKLYPFGGEGRLELYRISIKELNRSLDTIMLARGDRETVYKQVGDGDVPIDTPLRLTGPRRPYAPYDEIHVVFGDQEESRWRLKIDYEEEMELHRIDCPVTKEVVDCGCGLSETGPESVAVVSYQIMSKAVDAELELYGDRTRPLLIHKGEIYATTDGLVDTKRVLRSFGTTKRRRNKSPRYNLDEIRPQDKIELDRSLLALPMGSNLQVTVDLEYSCPVDENKPFRGFIKRTHIFCVPDSRSKSPPGIFTDGKIQLILEVSWTDDLAANFSKWLASLDDGMGDICEDLKKQGFEMMEWVTFVKTLKNKDLMLMVIFLTTLSPTKRLHRIVTRRVQKATGRVQKVEKVMRVRKYSYM